MKTILIAVMILCSEICFGQHKKVYNHRPIKEIKVTDTLSRKEAYLKYIELKKKGVPDSVNVYYKLLKNNNGK